MTLRSDEERKVRSLSQSRLLDNRRTISYPVGRYDDALKDARALKIFKAELYYCFKGEDGLHAEQIW